MAVFRRIYGARPMHLVGSVLALGLAVIALPKLLDAGPVMNLAVWLLGAIILHDLVVVPAYGAVDRVATRAVGVRAINHLRVPTVIAALLFVVYFPLITGLAHGFQDATGRGTGVYVWRWLAISAALYAVSAALYALRTVRNRRRVG